MSKNVPGQVPGPIDGSRSTSKAMPYQTDMVVVTIGHQPSSCPQTIQRPITFLNVSIGSLIVPLLKDM